MNGGINYVITNMTGQQLQKGRILSYREPLSIAELPDGLYVITLMADGQVVSQRFSKFSGRP